ncbi:hypothetical protein pb186bvf_008051 [Paramecium bursaria]
MQQTQEEFYVQQSQQLREKYQKAKQGSTDSVDNPEKDKAIRVLYLLLIIYAIILITFVVFLYQVASFRYLCYGFLEDINDQGYFIGPILLGLVGFWFVLTGFNVVFYDIIVGFLIRPFWYALLVVSVAKFLAKYVGFLCGRYKFRNYIYTAMNENIYFITCYLAAERKPYKVMFLIQFLFIPTIFKTYACGLFRISHAQFIHPTIFGTVVWAAFWVYVGARLETIADALQSGDTNKYVPKWFNFVMTIIIILIVIYFFRLTNQIYKEIQEDASLAELSHIIEKEEEIEQQRESQNNKSHKQKSQSPQPIIQDEERQELLQ